MIKLVIFDLDGVLVDSREMHFKALNEALREVNPKYIISKDEHLSTYDGLSTTKKLKILTEKKGLPVDQYDFVWKKKQEYTWKIVNTDYTYDERIRNILKSIKQRDVLIYIASNCIYKTLKMILLRKGYLEYIDYFISNEDVKLPKPNPEIYFRCMIRAGTTCKETLIVEDSHIGRKAASDSGAHMLGVKNADDLDLKKVEAYLNMNTCSKKQKWQGECTVVIPMAGAGSRFVAAGYSFPKPLIDVRGKPMIQVVVENLGLDYEKAKFVFICQKSHMEKYNVKYLLKAMVPNCEIIIVDGVTQGAACSILLAKEYINNDKNLILANSDQFLEWDANVFMYSMIADNIDAGITTFKNSHPKWSYAKLGEDGFVCEVAEKKPISDNATTGIYFWKHGSDFVKYAEQMIKKNIRFNNEFYTCPVFNEAIQDGLKIKIFEIDRMWGLGTPEDMVYFLNNYKDY